MLKILSDRIINQTIGSSVKINRSLQLWFRISFFFQFTTKSIQNKQNLKFLADLWHKIWELHSKLSSFLTMLWTAKVRELRMQRFYLTFLHITFFFGPNSSEGHRIWIFHNKNSKISLISPIEPLHSQLTSCRKTRTSSSKKMSKSKWLNCYLATQIELKFALWRVRTTFPLC